MSREIRTNGGPYFEGPVDTQGGDVVDRKIIQQQVTINISYQSSPFVLEKPNLNQLRDSYLGYIQDSTQYLDFKGTGLIEAVEKASGLSLEQVYVPLRARPDIPEGETWQRIAGRLWQRDKARQPAEEDLLPSLPSVNPVLVEDILNDAPALVLLGDPGAGKSTVLKMLAMALSRIPEGPLPILVPLSAYANVLQKESTSLHAFLASYFASRQSRLRGLAPLFDAALAKGQAVVLLDGLDEVQVGRGYLVRLVEDFVREHLPHQASSSNSSPGNRVIVTSRFVGYREAPLTDPRWKTFALVDWEQEEIESFTRRWTLAVELAVAGGLMDEIVQKKAEREYEELLEAIFADPGIERLAGNPLLLTILALIKRQGVMLPHRRVELYELYLRALLSTWNRARNLDQQPVGPDMDYLEAVQVLAPLALWLRETNIKSGLVSLAQMRGFLTQFYEESGIPRSESGRMAREFLSAVHRYTNLLLERGSGLYGFIHLTFEEYLAGVGLTLLDSKAMYDKIIARIAEPGWYETLLLGVEALAVVSRQPHQTSALLDKLLETQVPMANRGANVLLSGRVLLDIGTVGMNKRTADRIVHELEVTLQDEHVVAHRRRQAGQILGDFGWLPPDLEELVEAPRAEFLFGETERKIIIPYQYWIAKYPVTNAQYSRFIEDQGYERSEFWSEQGWAWRIGSYDSQAAGFEQELLARREVTARHQPVYWEDRELANSIFPVVGITWFEAQAYCNWLNIELQKTRMIVEGQRVSVPAGYSVRLPTEEEWECVARGLHGNEYPWQAGFDFSKANVATEFGTGIGTTAVCTYPQGASSAGAWDMSGNVKEWTSTWADEKRQFLVLRGGSWDDDSSAALCTARTWLIPFHCYDAVGFRVVVSLMLPLTTWNHKQ